MMKHLVDIVDIVVIEQVTSFLLADVSGSLDLGLGRERRSDVDAELWPRCLFVLEGEVDAEILEEPL